MAIRNYETWLTTEATKHLLSYELAYEAGVKAATEHYESEFVATAEYFSSVLNRTSDINLDIAQGLVEVADMIPEIGDRIDDGSMKDLQEKLTKLKEAVDEKSREDSST